MGAPTLVIAHGEAPYGHLLYLAAKLPALQAADAASLPDPGFLPMKRALALFASARPDGNTARALRQTIGQHQVPIVDLVQARLSPYDYQHRNLDDDFVPIVQRMMSSDLLIFASPVYWYSMCSPMKVFFDRFSDLLNIHKEYRAGLRGRECYLIGSGASDTPPDSYLVPFSHTCNYLGMQFREWHYWRDVYPQTEERRREQDDAAAAFGARILAEVANAPANP
jgi:putative NADPH-quinone reductase